MQTKVPCSHEDSHLNLKVQQKKHRLALAVNAFLSFTPINSTSAHFCLNGRKTLDQITN